MGWKLFWNSTMLSCHISIFFLKMSNWPLMLILTKKMGLKTNFLLYLASYDSDCGKLKTLKIFDLLHLNNC